MNTSPPKIKMAPPKAKVTPFEWLSQNTVRLASEITENNFSRHPELRERYGPRGKQKCIEDTAYHLHYLAEAIAADSPKLFIDCIGWAKIMLCSRGMDVRDLENSLHEMGHLLGRKASQAHKDVFGRYIGLALDALPALPDTVPSFIHPGEPFSAIANAYLNSLLVLDHDAAIAGILQECEHGLSIQNLFQHVLYPVQQEVGRLWQENLVTVVQEHYCTAASDLLIAKMRRKNLGVARNVSALAVCAEGEEHGLGLKMLSEILEADGWKVIYIGTNPPISDVLKFLKANATDLVAISVATAPNFGKTRKLIHALKALPLDYIPRILLGGMAINSDPNLWQSLGADAFGASLLEGLEAANRLVRSHKKIHDVVAQNRAA